MLIGFRRRPSMSIEAFKDYRRDVHAPLLFVILEAAVIRRFVVSYPVAAPNRPEPSFDAVIEACFETMEDTDGLFLSDNFLAKGDPDHANFIDLTSISRIVSQEIIVVA